MVGEEEEDKDTNEPTRCDLQFKPQRKELMYHTKGIIWDELFASSREQFAAAYDATDRFKYMVLICTNDCRQIGHVVRNGNRHYIVNATIINYLKTNKYADLIWDIGNEKKDSMCFDGLEEDEDMGVHLPNIPDIYIY